MPAPATARRHGQHSRAPQGRPEALLERRGRRPTPAGREGGTGARGRVAEDVHRGHSGVRVVRRAEGVRAGAQTCSLMLVLPSKSSGYGYVPL